MVIGSVRGNVVMSQGRVLVSGQDITPPSTPGEAPHKLIITITDDVASLQVDSCVTLTVNGSVQQLRSGSGDVHVAQGAQTVETKSGNVSCGDVASNVQSSSGDVTCGTVAGSVSTKSGDIRRR